MKNAAASQLGAKRISAADGEPTAMRVELSLKSLLIALALIAAL